MSTGGIDDGEYWILLYCCDVKKTNDDKFNALRCHNIDVHFYLMMVMMNQACQFV